MRSKIVKIIGLFLILSTLTVPTMRQQMIFAYNMHNLFRSTAVSEDTPGEELYFLISRGKSTPGHLRIF
ncbi:MAG TPA: hypothetical protein GXZ24_01635 [Firmicutes bacterium]|jgi:hypothetical protein|nr:hypothetical protein [Bacillota bacterium]